MAKNSSKSGNISGRNIYLDRRGQTVYYDMFSKKGYIIDSNAENKFYIYRNRYILIALAVMLVGEYFPSWNQAIIAGLAVCVLAEIMYRIKFLPSLRQTTKFDRGAKRTLLKAIIEANDFKKTVLRAVLYIAFAVLIVINALMMNAETPIIVICVALSIFGAYNAIVNIMAIIKMK